jgi:hypothetical protein
LPTFDVIAISILVDHTVAVQEHRGPYHLPGSALLLTS